MKGIEDFSTPPPVIGKVTHFSIELYWEEAREKVKNLIKTANKGDGRIKISVQEQGKSSKTEWTNVYAGYSKSHVIDNLEEWSQYTFRMRFEHQELKSPWSPHVMVSTTKEPFTGAHLHSAIFTQTEERIMEVLESGHLQSVDTLDKNGLTPLMQVARKGTEYTDLLIQYGADVNFKNTNGKTALMEASFAGKLGVIKDLMYNGAKVNLKDNGGATALHFAVDVANVEVIDYLIEKEADIEATDNHGWTPLFRCAALNGNIDSARSLVRQNAIINRKDIDKKTPLMIAVVNGHTNLVQLLCDNCADVNATNEYGQTAIQMAESMDRRMVLKILEECKEKKHQKSIHQIQNKIN